MTEVKIKIVSIVGCKYYKGNNTEEEFLESLMTKVIMLSPEPENPHDSKCVAAKVDGNVIGHVRAKNQMELNLFDFINSKERKLIPAIPKSMNLQYCSLDVELHCDVDSVDGYTLPPQLRGWEYTGVVLDKPMKMKRLEEAVSTLLVMLENGLATAENMRGSFDIFKENAMFGFSCEILNDRDKIHNLLKNSEDPKLRDMAMEMETMSGSLHEKRTHYEAFCELRKDLKKQVVENMRKKVLLTVNKKRLTQEMEAFHDKFYLQRKDVPAFALKLYYMFLPCDILMKFLSGMAILGALGAKRKKPAKKARKRPGRPRLKAGDRNFYNLINGNNRFRELWMEEVRQLLKGKKGKDVGMLMCALSSTGIVSDVPYAYVKDTFGNDIGTEKDYNCGKHKEYINSRKPQYDHFVYMIKQSNEKIQKNCFES